MRSVPESWAKPSPTSWYGRYLARRARHPQEFDCAVRVVSGDVPGESARWRYRRSAVDPLTPDPDVVILTHGDVVLRLRFTGGAGRVTGGLRPYHRVWTAVETVTGAALEVAADVGEGVRFGPPD